MRIFGEVDVDHLAPAISAQPASLRAWLVAALREVDGRSGIGWGYDLRAFDAAVDDVIDGADPAQAAAHVSAPADAPALLKLVSGLRGLAGDSTPEDVATRLRTSFLAAAADRQAQWVHRHHAVATVPGVQRRRYPSRTGTVLTLVIAAVLAVVVGGVLAVLSSFADPASLLYPVKRSSEATLVAVSLDPVDRAQLEIKLAQTRAREAEDMAGRGDGDRAAAAVDDRFRLLRAAARDLVSTSVHDARWRAARDRLFRESDVAMTTVDTDLQAGGQTRSAQDVERLVADYQRDRKTLESQLGRPSPQQGPPAATPPPPVPAPSS